MDIMKKVTKVIIPAAGYGTRFLPITKSIPKAMLPIIDKPIIQNIIEEADNCGLKNIIVVTRKDQQIIKDFFSKNYSLENLLCKSGQEEELNIIKRIAELGKFSILWQNGPLGTGSAVLNAQKMILRSDIFLILFGDDYFVATPSRTEQLLNAFNKYQVPILCGIKPANQESRNHYAFAEVKQIDKNTFRLLKLHEKPGNKYPNLNIAVVSGYILDYDVFSSLNRISKTLKPGEQLRLTDAINDLILCKKKILVRLIENGEYFDMGNRITYVKAIIKAALKRPDMKNEISSFMKSLAQAS